MSTPKKADSAIPDPTPEEHPPVDPAADLAARQRAFEREFRKHMSTPPPEEVDRKIFAKFIGPVGWSMPDPPVPGADMTLDQWRAAVKSRALTRELTERRHLFKLRDVSLVADLPETAPEPHPSG